MTTLIGAISVFGLGWVANELTDIPSLVIEAACFVSIIGILILNNKRTRK